MFSASGMARSFVSSHFCTHPPEEVRFSDAMNFAYEYDSRENIVQETLRVAGRAAAEEGICKGRPEGRYEAGRGRADRYGAEN